MRGRQHTAARPELEHAPLLAAFLPLSIASANEQLLHTLPALNSTGAPQFAYTIRLLPRCRWFLHTDTPRQIVERVSWWSQQAFFWKLTRSET